MGNVHAGSNLRLFTGMHAGSIFFLATCSPAPTHKPASMLGDGDHRRAAEATMAATPWLQGRLQKLSEILGCSATVLTHR